jgi:hypothetical protein
MTERKKHRALYSYIAAFLAALYGVCGIPGAWGYAFDQIVPDVRQPVFPEAPRVRWLRTTSSRQAPSRNNGARCLEPIR